MRKVTIFLELTGNQTNEASMLLFDWFDNGLSNCHIDRNLFWMLTVRKEVTRNLNPNLNGLSSIWQTWCEADH